jgi:hypothetical protein
VIGRCICMIGEGRGGSMVIVWHFVFGHTKNGSFISCFSL